MSAIVTNKYNLNIWQGSTFGIGVEVRYANNTPQPIDGFQARMQLRSNYRSDVIIESLSTANGEITFTGSTGGLQIELSADRTANIPVDLTNGKPPKSLYVYDLELIDSDNKVSKLLYGDVAVYGEVTR